MAQTYGHDWSGTDYCYWLSALDVFEAGDSLPNRSKIADSVTSEDWRMSIAWGFALVCLAKVVQKRTQAAKDLPPTDAPLLVEEPQWRLDSPFHAILSKTPPLTRQFHLQGASPQELLLLAQDHIYRGILYMPRSGWSPTGMFSESIATLPISKVLASNAPREFLKISADILSIAEQFEEPSERQSWAQFADVVLNAVQGVEDEPWKTSILLGRGKCQLASAFAKMQALGMDLQAPESHHQVLDSYRARSARKTLSSGWGFNFQRANVIH